MEAIIDKLKEMVEEFVPDKGKAKMLLEKIEDARECVNMTEGMREEILKQLIEGMVPTFAECRDRAKDMTEPEQKKSAMKECFKEKAQKFKEITGMTEEETTMLQKTENCISEKFQL
ncbi:uncharacterized protein [Dermacentor albipictus]|uniref:uncharacterized protein isoform X2 n=1 Tax=Dermacentor albipictus TaxID=60249 RepID=UPI0038FD2E07